MNFFKNNKKIDNNNLPYHTAFIIDGNGRWAQNKGLPRTVGHRQGVYAVKKAIQNCCNLGLKEISFYCFSTENWNRPKSEIDAIFNMLRDFLNEDIKPYKEKGIKFVVSGDLTKLPQDLVDALLNAVNDTKSCNNMIVNLCINYSGRSEILRAVNNLIKCKNSEINSSDFENELYTKNLHDVDLVIRTSGEQRISNFMLWQISYAELYFTKTYWPDFDKKELEKAILDYQKRNRRFGAIKN